MTAPPSETLLFLGRFHPLLVHLPIGLILLAALFEVLSRRPRFRQASAVNRLILSLAVPAVAGSALCGWLLSRDGGYDPHLLNWHKWTGLAVAVASLLALLFHHWEAKRPYHATLLLTALLLTVASHFGGSLTHGRDYLTRYAPAPLRQWLALQPAPRSPTDPATNQALFATAILPFLEKHCVGCHGPDSAKGGLRLDSLAALLKGTDDGPVLLPGQPAASSLLKRLHLPPEDDDHMPPTGKPQPSADQIALLEWWIQAGASGDKTIAQLNPPPNLRRLLEPRSAVPATAAAAQPKPVGEVLPLAEQLATELGIEVSPLSPTEPWLQCNASMAGTNFGDAELAKLAPLAPNVRWLDLGGTRVTDAGLVHVAAMKNLTKLHLERSAIGDAGLAELAGLEQLEYLNLYGTSVSDEGLASLKPLSKLRQLYLWQTKVSSNAAKTFAAQFTDQDQIKRWQDEIAALQAKLRRQGLAVDLGIPLLATNTLATNAVATNVLATNTVAAKPINAKCPISGKDIDPSKTSLYEGKLVAFCCDQCQAAFARDPKPSLSKLGLAATPAGSVKPSTP